MTRSVTPKNDLKRRGPHRKALRLSTIAPISRDLAYERHVRPIETELHESDSVDGTANEERKSIRWSDYYDRVTSRRVSLAAFFEDWGER